MRACDRYHRPSLTRAFGGRASDEVAVDVVPGDIVAEAGLRGDVDEPLVVHRIDQRVEPRWRHIVVDERVERPRSEERPGLTIAPSLRTCCFTGVRCPQLSHGIP